MIVIPYLVYLFLLPQDSKVQLQAPTSVPAGSALEITWSEGGDPNDFITIVPKDTPDGKYKSYKYAKVKTWEALAPEEPGAYEIRYLAAKAPYATLASQPLQVTAVTATVSVPATVSAGSEILVEWTGPDNPRDFITIVKADTPEGKYAKYQYTKRGNPTKLKVPDAPGAYEVRYLTGQKYFTLASAPITATSVSASVSAPDQVDAGALFEVHWTGPDNARDFVTIVEKGTPDRKYGKYVYTKKGSPITLPAPEQVGDYEIRYLTGEKYFTLATAAIKVVGVTATVSVVPSVNAGSKIDIHWTGPDNPRDYVTIVEAGAAEGTYGRYVYTKKGTPISLLVPEEPGTYEARYVTGGKELTLASAAFEVTQVKATLTAPAEVKAGTSFHVSWTGPDNPQDFIAIVKAGGALRAWESYRYTLHGQPSLLRSPLEPGSYELRYQTGQKYLVLASRELTVTPADLKPGSVKVVEGSNEGLSEGAGLELILDASGSMLQKINGKRRIDIAKTVLMDLVTNQLPAGTPVAMRVFGHKEADACRTDLEIPLAPLNVSQVVGKIENIQAMNLAKTPIADSLDQVANDLAGVRGQRVVVLITDGEETCGGDPAETIRRLKEAGIDLRVNIVGFAIDDADLKQAFAQWSELGGGNYFDARDADQLSASLGGALQIPFDVVDGSGQVVADGLVGGPAIEVPAGTYQLRTRETPARIMSDVVIAPDTLRTVTLK